MKNVFITGGFGFVGTHLAERLLARPSVERVTVYDNLSSGTEGLKYLNPTDPVTMRRVGAVIKNIRDYDALRVAMEGHDTVFHLAANPDIARAVREPTIDFEQGTILTQNVLEAMRVNGVKRLIYFSGSGVYGENPDVAFREDYGPMEPISTYGASKLASEALICAYCAMFGLTARAFRFANVVGPRQTHGVGYDFLRKLKADATKLVVLGDGRQSKSYLHVEDCLDAVMTIVGRVVDPLLAKYMRPYDVYNVATGDYLTVTEIAQMASELVISKDDWMTMKDGRNVKTETAIEYTGGSRGWKGDVPVVRFDCSKIHALGWRCQKNSRQAMQAALEAMAEELVEASA